MSTRDFTMPSLGADMETGKVVQWHVRAGDRVKPGDVVCVVETHKGAIDVECFEDGVIDDLAPVGQSMPVGALLAHVHSEAAASGPRSPPELSAELSPEVPPEAPAEVPPEVPPAAAPATRVRASPAARRLADERGVALQGLAGHGVDGGITLADVAAVAASGRPPPPGERAPAAPPSPSLLAPGRFDPAQMRRAIAAAMSRSKREIPHYYLGRTIAFGAASEWITRENAQREPDQRLLPAVLLLKAAALALARVPQLNGRFVDGAFVPGDRVHVGWAVALRGGGLVAPAIHDADRQPLDALMSALRDLVQRARSGGLRSSELTDASATVTSLGERGADSVHGVIVPPQVALIGFGRVRVQPWVIGDAVLPCPLIHASLAADHRASDGHLGGRLLAAIDDALQAPDELDP